MASRQLWRITVSTCAALLSGAVLAGLALSAETPAAGAFPKTIVGPGGQTLEAVEIKLPRPLFQGTPKHIKPAPTLEKYTEAPRPPFYAVAGVTNIALNKKVTSSDMEPIVGELTMATDGDKEGADGSFVELGPGLQWLQIDLGKVSEIHGLCVWHFHAEGRVYHDVVVQASNDPEFQRDVVTIFNNDFDNSSKLGAGKDLEYIEDYRGKLIDARDKQGNPIKARYVRLYSKGNTSNDMNHYVEVEVYGK